MSRACSLVLGVGMLLAAPALAETHTLFLDFNGDAGFPEYGPLYTGDLNILTNPLDVFDANDLNSAWGAAETTNLHNNVLSRVRQVYREFNLTVTDVQPGSGNYQTVGIDGRVMDGGNIFGLAKGIDSNPDDADHGRVWGGSFATFSNFQGANSTLVRWTRALAYTTAHEAGHNYGLTHGDSDPTPGEAAAGQTAANHIMASGVGGRINMEQRATLDRRFSDTSYGKLGAVLGLATNTLSNWDFTNPNSEAANDLHIKFYSKHASLTDTWHYTGGPFSNLAVTRSPGNVTYKGDPSWYQYDVSWTGGTVPAGTARFHEGIAFAESNDFIITEAILTKDGAPLPLRPRIASTPAIFLNALNHAVLQVLNPHDEDLILRNFRLMLLPRMGDLNTMTSQFDLPLDIDGLPINALPAVQQPDAIIPPGQFVEFDLGSLDVWRRIKLKQFLSDLADGTGETPDDLHADPTLLDLFPSAYIYGIADAVTPGQQIWDPQRQAFFTGDLTTTMYFQLSGMSQFIPEPGSLAILVLGGLTLCWRKRH